MGLPPNLEGLFPGLASGYEQTSEASDLYNCIGYAAGDTAAWWEPMRGSYWPHRVPRDYSLTSLQVALATVGYAACESEELQAGVEKVAIFVNTDGMWEHAARQLADGYWTSKIGRNEDIRHHLRQLEGAEYGYVVSFMSRPRR